MQVAPLFPLAWRPRFGETIGSSKEIDRSCGRPSKSRTPGRVEIVRPHKWRLQYSNSADAVIWLKRGEIARKLQLGKRLELVKVTVSERLEKPTGYNNWSIAERQPFFGPHPSFIPNLRNAEKDLKIFPVRSFKEWKTSSYSPTPWCLLQTKQLTYLWLAARLTFASPTLEAGLMENLYTDLERHSLRLPVAWHEQMLPQTLNTSTNSESIPNYNISRKCINIQSRSETVITWSIPLVQSRCTVVL